MIHKISLLTLTTFFLICLTSCSPFKNKEYKNECQKVVKVFKQSFTRQNSGVFLLKDSHSITQFSDLYNTNFNRCFDGLHKADLVKLFGEPSKKEEGGYLYYLDEQCWDVSLAGCHSFSFMFDSTKEYVQMSVYLSKSDGLRQ